MCAADMLLHPIRRQQRYRYPAVLHTSLFLFCKQKDTHISLILFALAFMQTPLTIILCIKTTADDDSPSMPVIYLPPLLPSSHQTLLPSLGNPRYTMGLHSPLTLLSFLSLLTLSFQATNLQDQSNFLSLMKQSLSGPSMSQLWDFSGPSTAESPYCNLSGIGCDDRGYITKIDISFWSLVGRFPSGVCSYLPKLRILRMDHNNIHSGFPDDLLNCSFLEELNLTFSGLTGTLPDLSPLQSLRSLDLSNNLFSGAFPISVTNITGLEVINFNQNPGFDVWKLPEVFTRLTKLKVMILSTTSMRGEIPEWIGNMTSLTDLELSGNLLVGSIPATIGKLRSLQLLELYYNELSGGIPDELGNLTQLANIDLSENRLTGTIPGSLCRLRGLQVLQLYTNRLTGEIPRVLGNSTTLRLLSIYRNFLTGEVPATIGKFSQLMLLELSENRFTGELPREACTGGQLLYYLVLDNLFTGELPDYSRCVTLIRFRVSNNQLSGLIPEGILALPHAYIIDLGFNRFQGVVPKTIGNAKNLSNLFLENNQISGTLPPEISRATGLVKIDISNNFLSGPIPSEIGNLNKLNQLSLQGNRLDSSIPESLSSLKSLNVLNLSNNLLTGEIPESLCELLPNSLDFSNNRLSGPVPLPLIKEGLIESVSGNPGLCTPIHLNLTDRVLPLCPQPNIQKRLNNIWVVGVSVMIAVLGILLFTKRWFGRKSAVIEHDGFSSSSSSYDVKSFHKLSFDQHEIVQALIDKNIVGHGGSGTVYKIELSSGELVAVKKVWSRKTKVTSSGHLYLDRELRSEVETLGSIRHKNIVKLYCCFSSLDSNLLVYEYMPNGNLWDALHSGWSFLDWPTRHRIALGIAQGLAYLHHDLLYPIVHRDIKTSNILLDAEFEPKVADFGIAKVLQARGESDASTTVVAGTYGYLAPEYAYSSKATTKCDVYSFGVVLLELITGKKPNEPEFGENRDIIHWVSTKMVNKDGATEVLDMRLSWSPFKEEMVQVLRIALRCTCSMPALRPSMNEVVQHLIEANPCKADVGASSFKLKDCVPAAKA